MAKRSRKNVGEFSVGEIVKIGQSKFEILSFPSRRLAEVREQEKSEKLVFSIRKLKKLFEIVDKG